MTVSQEWIERTDRAFDELFSAEPSDFREQFRRLLESFRFSGNFHVRDRTRHHDGRKFADLIISTNEQNWPIEDQVTGDDLAQGFHGLYQKRESDPGLLPPDERQSGQDPMSRTEYERMLRERYLQPDEPNESVKGKAKGGELSQREEFGLVRIFTQSRRGAEAQRA